MKKTMKNNFSERLTKYGALSLAIAGVSNVAGQVVYTDVDPDFTGGATDVFNIDFNNDGMDDVSIVQSNNGIYEHISVTPASGNGVLAASNSGYLYASNLSAGTAINSAAGSFRSIGDLCAGAGYAGSQFCGATDGYIGVQFAVGGSTYYGWIRVDVADSSNFVVKDFAYESTAGTAIAAGDTGTAGIEDQIFEGFSFFVDKGHQLNLSANAEMQSLQLFDLLGKKVLSQNLDGNNASIDLSSLENGVYLATININGASKTFKILR